MVHTPELSHITRGYIPNIHWIYLKHIFQNISLGFASTGHSIPIDSPVTVDFWNQQSPFSMDCYWHIFPYWQNKKNMENTIFHRWNHRFPWISHEKSSPRSIHGSTRRPDLGLQAPERKRYSPRYCLRSKPAGLTLGKPRSSRELFSTTKMVIFHGVLMGFYQPRWWVNGSFKGIL